jgi:hypothetical protein
MMQEQILSINKSMSLISLGSENSTSIPAIQETPSIPSNDSENLNALLNKAIVNCIEPCKSITKILDEIDKLMLTTYGDQELNSQEEERPFKEKSQEFGLTEKNNEGSDTGSFNMISMVSGSSIEVLDSEQPSEAWSILDEIVDDKGMIEAISIENEQNSMESEDDSGPQEFQEVQVEVHKPEGFASENAAQDDGTSEEDPEDSNAGNSEDKIKVLEQTSVEHAEAAFQEPPTSIEHADAFPEASESVEQIKVPHETLASIENLEAASSEIDEVQPLQLSVEPSSNSNHDKAFHQMNEMGFSMDNETMSELLEEVEYDVSRAVAFLTAQSKPEPQNKRIVLRFDEFSNL